MNAFDITYIVAGVLSWPIITRILIKRMCSDRRGRILVERYDLGFGIFIGTLLAIIWPVNFAYLAFEYAIGKSRSIFTMAFLPKGAEYRP